MPHPHLCQTSGVGTEQFRIQCEKSEEGMGINLTCDERTEVYGQNVVSNIVKTCSESALELCVLLEVSSLFHSFGEDREMDAKWQSADPVTQEWLEYPHDIQRTLEDAFQRNEPEVRITIVGRMFVVDFKSMEQRNDLGFGRPIRRVKIGASDRSADGPSLPQTAEAAPPATSVGQSEVPPTAVPKSTVRWQYEDPDSLEWRDYGGAAAVQLEEADAAGHSEVVVSLGGRTFKVNLDRMVQVNEFHFLQKIRRVEKQDAAEKPDPAATATAPAAATLPKGVIWESEDPATKEWVAYPPETAAQLESALRAGHGSKKLLFLGKPYTFDFSAYLQINEYNASRYIRRREVETDIGEAPLSANHRQKSTVEGDEVVVDVSDAALFRFKVRANDNLPHPCKRRTT